MELAQGVPAGHAQHVEEGLVAVDDPALPEHRHRIVAGFEEGAETRLRTQRGGLGVLEFGDVRGEAEQAVGLFGPAQQQLLQPEVAQPPVGGRHEHLGGLLLAAGKHQLVGCPHVLDDFGGSSSLSCIPELLRRALKQRGGGGWLV
jgi:hypothetical protein